MAQVDRKENGKTFYRVGSVAKKDVPQFLPALTSTVVFPAGNKNLTLLNLNSNFVFLCKFEF